MSTRLTYLVILKDTIDGTVKNVLEKVVWNIISLIFGLKVFNQTAQTNITTSCKIKTTELVETNELKPTMSENKALKEVFESHLFPSTIVSDVFCSPTPQSRG